MRSHCSKSKKAGVITCEVLKGFSFWKMGYEAITEQ